MCRASRSSSASRPGEARSPSPSAERTGPSFKVWRVVLGGGADPVPGLEDYLRLARERTVKLFGLDRPAADEQRVATAWSVSLDQVRA